MTKPKGASDVKSAFQGLTLYSYNNSGIEFNQVQSDYLHLFFSKPEKKILWPDPPKEIHYVVLYGHSHSM